MAKTQKMVKKQLLQQKREMNDNVHINIMESEDNILNIEQQSLNPPPPHPLPVVNGFLALEITMPASTHIHFISSNDSFLPLSHHFNSKSIQDVFDDASTFSATLHTHTIMFRKHQVTPATQNNINNNNVNNSGKTLEQQQHEFPVGRTLFMCNLPVDTTEAHLKRIFRRCGQVERVSLFAGRNNSTTSATAVASGNAASYARSGHVVFEDEDACDRALAMRMRKRVWSDKIQDEDGDGDDANSSSGTLKIGMAKWIADHIQRHPPLKSLQHMADAHMQAFEEMEEARMRELEARRNKPDEDGFTVVTRGGKGDSSTAATSDSGGSGSNRKRKAKGSEKLVDFYRFQMREAKRNQLAELRLKFEQDKSKIAALKANRRFKPF